MTDQYLPQPYPLWCAEVSFDDRTVMASRVISWWLPDEDMGYPSADAVPVLARTRGGMLHGPVTSMTTADFGPASGNDTDLIFADTHGLAVEKGCDHLRFELERRGTVTPRPERTPQ